MFPDVVVIAAWLTGTTKWVKLKKLWKEDGDKDEFMTLQMKEGFLKLPKSADKPNPLRRFSPGEDLSIRVGTATAVYNKWVQDNGGKDNDESSPTNVRGLNKIKIVAAWGDTRQYVRVIESWNKKSKKNPVMYTVPSGKAVPKAFKGEKSPTEKQKAATAEALTKGERRCIFARTAVRVYNATRPIETSKKPSKKPSKKSAKKQSNKPSKKTSTKSSKKTPKEPSKIKSWSLSSDSDDDTPLLPSSSLSLDEHIKRIIASVHRSIVTLEKLYKEKKHHDQLSKGLQKVIIHAEERVLDVAMRHFNDDGRKAVAYTKSIIKRVEERMEEIFAHVAQSKPVKKLVKKPIKKPAETYIRKEYRRNKIANNRYRIEERPEKWKPQEEAVNGEIDAYYKLRAKKKDRDEGYPDNWGEYEYDDDDWVDYESATKRKDWWYPEEEFNDYDEKEYADYGTYNEPDYDQQYARYAYADDGKPRQKSIRAIAMELSLDMELETKHDVRHFARALFVKIKDQTDAPSADDLSEIFTNIYNEELEREPSQDELDQLLKIVFGAEAVEDKEEKTIAAIATELEQNMDVINDKEDVRHFARELWKRIQNHTVTPSFEILAPIFKDIYDNDLLLDLPSKELNSLVTIGSGMESIIQKVEKNEREREKKKRAAKNKAREREKKKRKEEEKEKEKKEKEEEEEEDDEEEDEQRYGLSKMDYEEFMKIRRKVTSTLLHNPKLPSEPRIAAAFRGLDCALTDSRIILPQALAKQTVIAFFKDVYERTPTKEEAKPFIDMILG
jgi:hypothetical protein